MEADTPLLSRMQVAPDTPVDQQVIAASDSLAVTFPVSGAAKLNVSFAVKDVLDSRREGRRLSDCPVGLEFRVVRFLL